MPSPLDGLKKTTPAYPREAEQVLQDAWAGHTNKGIFQTADGYFVPLPRPPSPREPFVNDPEGQRALHNLLKVAPHMSNVLGNITIGPNADTMDQLEGSQFTEQDFHNLNLLGTTNTRNNNISINPKLHGPELDSTLVHELTHAAGYGDKTAYKVQGNFNKARGK